MAQNSLTSSHPSGLIARDFEAPRPYGVFLRALWLPRPVEPDKVRADFENGVLTVTLPKCTEQEQRRKIPVQHGGEQTSKPSSRPAGRSSPHRRLSKVAAPTRHKL